MKLLLKANAKKIIAGSDLSEVPAGIGLIKLEDISFRPSFLKCLGYKLSAFLLPARALFRSYCYTDSNANSAALIVSSRGSKAEPVLIALSHANICANTESITEVLQLETADAILAAIPFSHGYGAVTNLWLPLLSGIKIVFIETEPEAQFGNVIAKQRVSTIFDRSSNLPRYLTLDPKDSKSLSRLVSGGEHLDPDLALQLEEKLKIEVLEGYGCSEVSAVALLNVPGFSAGRYSQTGKKAGSVGHPIPGIVVRVLNENNLQPLPHGEVGVLALKGPSLMLGYLGEKQRSSSVTADGWFISGDMARIDADGFVELL